MLDDALSARVPCSRQEVDQLSETVIWKMFQINAKSKKRSYRAGSPQKGTGAGTGVQGQKEKRIPGSETGRHESGSIRLQGPSSQEKRVSGSLAYPN